MLFYCIGLVWSVGTGLSFCLGLVFTYMAWSFQSPPLGTNRYYGQREDGTVF